MSEELSMLAKLDSFGFWTLQCNNSGTVGERHVRGQFRSYTCSIIHRHKRYRSTAKTIGNAVAMTINKAECGHDKGRLPKLRLVGV